MFLNKMNFFSGVGEFISHFNNVIQFIFFISSVIAILSLFTIPYIRPLKAILGSIGLNLREILNVLRVCYKKPRVLIRLYIELAIIRSKGTHHSKQWWKDFRRDFKKFLDDHESSGTYTIEVDTCFDLVPSDLNDLIKAYFDYFKGKKAADKFAIIDSEPVAFINELKVLEGYLVPLTFITGLNQRYNEDWEKILRNYFIAFNENRKPEHSILPEKLYFTYTWLMWGPSIQNKYFPNKYKLFQYGFGDESNSVNVVIRNDEAGNNVCQMFNLDSNHTEDKKFGYNCAITGKVIDTSEYYKFKSDNIDNLTIPFLKRLSKESLGIPFLFELVKLDIKTSAKSDNYYFSAYLWIMFHLDTPDDSWFHPQKTLTFFEHANLADSVNYTFLANRLIDKCFMHFDYIANHPTYKKRKYQYCLSMNSYIDKLFLERLNEKITAEKNEWYINNLLTEKPYIVGEVLDAFDNYFVSQEKSTHFLEVKINQKETVKQFCNFYAETYLEMLKILPQRLNLDQVLNLLRHKDNRFTVHSNMALNEENMVIGSTVTIFLPTLNCGIIDSLFVHPNHRNYGVGTSILEYSIVMMRNDVRKQKVGNLQYILTSIPVANDPADSKMLTHNERLWRNNGFRTYKQTANNKWLLLAQGEENQINIPENLLSNVSEELEYLKNKSINI